MDKRQPRAGRAHPPPPVLDDDTEVDRGAVVPAAGDLAGASLEVVKGDDAGTLFLLGLEGAVVGRGREADLRLGDPTISRRHLQIRFEAGAYLARDLGSPNGSQLDGESLRDWQRLPPHARIHLGRRTVIEFMALDETGLERTFEWQHIGEKLAAQRQHSRILAEQAEELHAAVADLEQFARAAAHDLVEPLRTIDGFADLLVSERGDELGEEGHQYVAHIAQASRRMQELLAALRRFSRLQSTDPAMIRVDLDEVLDDALADLATSLEEAGAVVRRDPLPTVVGDPDLLRLLFQNLLSNAIRFREPEVSPTIRITARSDGDAHAVTVRDDGIGLDMQHAERIFEVFRRLESRSRFEGTGIGLAIAKRVVERHGGRIAVISAPGEGASFRFWLPGSGASATRRRITLDPEE